MAKKMILAAFAALVAFGVYWRTLLPTVSLWGDSAKFQYIAQVWGIPHPTGYPLYILLTRLFTLLPVGDVAYRVNLLSAVCGAAAVGCLVLTAAEVSRDPFAATAAALMLAFSPIFWSQAVVAEVYALNALFVALCLGLLFRWREKGQPGAFYAFLLVYGLSFSHHLSMILLLPAFLFLIGQRERRVFIQPRSLLFGLLGAGLGLVPYTYILLRAAQGAVYSEFPSLAGRPLLIAFMDYVSGAQFRSGFFAAFSHGPAALLARVQFYVNLLGEQFGWWGIGLGLPGLILLWRRDRSLAVGLVLAFLGETIFPLGYEIIDPEVYFIPSYLIWALFISITLGWLRSKAGDLTAEAAELAERPKKSLRTLRPRRLVSIPLFLAVCIALPVLPLTRNRDAADQSHNFTARHWAEAFMQGMEPNARVVLPQPYFYSQKQALLYMMLAEGVKPGLEIIAKNEIDAWAGRRPVYLAVWMPEVAQRYELKPVDSSDLTLADFLAGLPEGTVVIAAVKDEASLRLSEEAAKAWHKVGGQVDLRGCFRCAHALIGVKGTGPGAALEKSGHEPLTLRVAQGGEIGTTGVRVPVELIVHSAGFDDGNVGDIWVAGRQVSPQHRGYNIVALDPHNGRLLTAVYADTFESDRVDNVRKYRVVVRR